MEQPESPDGVALERRWRPDWPVPVFRVLATHRRGRGDPTFRFAEDGAVWRGIGTPDGPATLRIPPLGRDGTIRAHAWGPGAAWALDSLPAMLGAHDDPTGFDPDHPVVRAALRRHAHWRLGRTGLVMESLLPAVIEQKVTGAEAFAGFRMLVHRYGERAPGPGRRQRLWIQPAAARIRSIPSWEWLRMHIDPARSRTAVQAAKVADALERTVGLESAEADRRLRTVPGIGLWTSAEVRCRAHGDADAVSFGDYHVAKDVGWALIGEAVDDHGLARLLEPFRPHRHRVQRLLQLEGLGRPRRGPRMAPRSHLPATT